MKQPARLSIDPTLEARRNRVMSWLINGYVINGKRVSVDDMAILEGTSPAEIRQDMSAVQRYTSKHLRNSSVMKDRLLQIFNNTVEMALIDRGRAVEQFERVKLSTTDQDGNIRPPDRDVSYQLYLFQKLAQDSTGNLIKLLNLTIGRSDVINQVVVNVNTENQTVTTARAMELLRDANAVLTLPSDRYRAALDNSPETR